MSAPAQPTADLNHPRRILAVEDIAVHADTIRGVFAGVSEVVVAPTLREAIDRVTLDSTGFDLAVLDLGLPDSAGLDTVIRFRAAAPRLPVVVLTATDDDEMGQRALACGVQNYLVKDDAYPRFLRREAVYAMMRWRHEASLVQALAQAEDANRLKDRFVSLLAHDLRGPMGAIFNMLEVLLRHRQEPLAENVRLPLDYIVHEGRGLLKVIDDVLDLSRLQTGRIRPAPAFRDGRFVAEAVIGRMRLLAAEKQVQLENAVAEGTRLYVDPALFRQVLQNLIGNAIKFSRRGGAVRIETSGEGMVGIAVRDSGVGIAPDRLGRLFEIESKTSTPGTEGERGTGFGLPLSQKIMEAHGGRIRVKSELGKGSVFVAELPAVVPLVLAIDDERTVRDTLTLYLQSIGAEAVLVADGQEALDAIKRGPLPHLVLADIYMPNMDGFELLRVLKADTATRDIPVIVITSDDSIETRRRAINLGALDFTVKPLVLHDFMPRVRRVIG